MKLLNTILFLLICIPSWGIFLIGAIWIGEQSITDKTVINLIELIVGMIWCIAPVFVIPFIAYIYIKSIWDRT